jgi:exosortase A-associated hydrolase 1
MTAYDEQAVVFECGGSRLVGIAAIPGSSANVGVLILVGGPQYRVGSHRQFTLLARSLAESGFASLRFDYRGMGDSEGAKSQFDEAEEDISCAIDALLASAPGVTRVVLWGLCDAASSALIFAYRHPRVAGVILLNPWVHSGVYSPQVKLAHYYRPSFAKKHQWRRLLSGQIRLLPAFRELAQDSLALLGRYSHYSGRKSANRSFIQLMLEGFEQFQHGILILLSEADLTAREFSTLVAHDAVWKAATSRPAVTIKTLTGADHTFSQKPWKDDVSRLTIEWLRQR